MAAHFHVRFTKHLAGAAMRKAIDRGAAFKANAHAAERRTRFAVDRDAAVRASHHDGSGDAGAGFDAELAAIDCHPDALRHGLSPRRNVRANRVRGG